MESYYDINVSLNGKHFFATAARSARDADKAAKLVNDFRRRFPPHEGFKVTVTYWQSIGRPAFEEM